jgi:hypothetical protein
MCVEMTNEAAKYGDQKKEIPTETATSPSVLAIWR